MKDQLKSIVPIEIINTSEGTLKLYKLLEITSDNEGEIKKGIYNSSQGKVYRVAIKLNRPHVEKYFDLDDDAAAYYNHRQIDGLTDVILKSIQNVILKHSFSEDFRVWNINIKNDILSIYLNQYTDELATVIQNSLRDHLYKKEMHITRMFGSYILLQKKHGRLQAVKATPIPLQYCPLMIQMLKEVGGIYAQELLQSLKSADKELQTSLMCKLINEVVIKGGFFDTNRPLNSCEANVLFGASETMSSAFRSGMIDAAVIVSNNLGTIITTNESNTQGAVKRMTGLFFTSPSKTIMQTAIDAKIIPVFPYTAAIDQLTGVKKAIELGYKKIAVSVAAKDNYLHKDLKKLETKGVVLYKFGLCSTGIDEKTAVIMKDYADIIWSCASKNIKKHIRPNAIAQIGIKIPVYAMSKRGWEITKNHLMYMNHENNLDDVTLCSGDDMPVCLNDNNKIKVIAGKEIFECTDCPHPYI
jgi:putative methanogenesis marker protein 8